MREIIFLFGENVIQKSEWGSEDSNSRTSFGKGGERYFQRTDIFSKNVVLLNKQLVSWKTKTKFPLTDFQIFAHDYLSTSPQTP